MDKLKKKGVKVDHQEQACKGASGSSQTQSLQIRVRDAFRRGLQWKWDRHRDRSLTRDQGPNRDETSSSQEPSSVQNRWPRISPVTIRKFRRLFSNAGSSDVSPESFKEPSKFVNNDGMTVVNSSPNHSGHSIVNPKMINMKSKEKKKMGKGKRSSSSSPISPPQSPASARSARKPCESGGLSDDESRCTAVSGLIKHFETLNEEIKQGLSRPASRASSRSSSRSGPQSLSEPPSLNSSQSSSHSPAKIINTTTDTPESMNTSEALHDSEITSLPVIKNTNFVVENGVPAVKNQEFITDQELATTCDTGQELGFPSDTGQELAFTSDTGQELCLPSDNGEGLAFTCDTGQELCVPSDNGEELDFSSDIGQELPFTPDTGHSKSQEEQRAQLQILTTHKDGSVKSIPGSNSSSKPAPAPPSIVTELYDADVIDSCASSQKVPLKKAHDLPSLQLTLDPDANSGSLARKSPVTVQEWVDSIPLTSHIDEEREAVEMAEGRQPGPESVAQGGAVHPLATIRSASAPGGGEAGHRREAFSRDASPSLQSDTGSHASSVDSFMEARRPDPEEVLLGLGFGGPLHTAEAEVSRIPSRFLQPSKVKGIDIGDFLKYQQDLIETFESGFCGYRGLTGGAQIPSVIVAKIMEKLREHERESSIKSSAGSSPAHADNNYRRRFSRAAQKVNILTKMRSRDSLGSGGQAPTSVLNPDNRKFLDNQGSKSPEVSRKRMIIGQRSFTFDCEGHLIEAEPISEDPAVPEVSQPLKPSLPRPLVHKDSVLSSATSLSLTSYDSDSDTDEASGGDRSIGGGIGGGGSGNNHQRLLRLHSTPVSSTQDSVVTHQESPLKSDNFAVLSDGDNLPRKSVPSAVHSIPQTASSDRSSDVLELPASSTPKRERSWRDLQRVNSAPSFSTSFSQFLSGKVLGTHKEEQPSQKPSICTGQSVKKHGLRADNTQEQSQRKHTKLEKGTQKMTNIFTGETSQEVPQRTPDSSCISSQQEGHLNQETAACDLSLPLHQPLLPRGDSFSSPVSSSSFGSESQYQQYLQRMYSMPVASAMFLDKATSRKLSLNASLDSYDLSSADQMYESKDWSSSSISSWESEAVRSPLFRFARSGGEFIDKLDQNAVGSMKEPGPEKERTPLASPSRRKGSLKRQYKVEEDDLVVQNESASELQTVKEVPHIQCLTVDQSRSNAENGDSFEMEELCVEEDDRVTRIGSTNSANSAHSDSSGFQEEQHQPSTVDIRPLLSKQLSESEPLLYTQTASEEQILIQPAEHLKRLSLPVIRIQDEWGHNQWRASRFYRETVPFSAPLRKVRSMPCRLSRIGIGRFSESASPGSVSDSISNMFSSCSDDSVIHIPTQSVDVTAGSDHTTTCSLSSVLMDFAGEPNARCATQLCCSCNTTLRATLKLCCDQLSSSSAKSESWSRLTCEVEALLAAQKRVNIEVHRIQNCINVHPDHNVAAVLDQVVKVVQHQGDLCNQLESLTAELPSGTTYISAHESDASSTSPFLCSNSCLNCQQMPVSCQLAHPGETCLSVCQKIREENHHLQDLVRQNADELVQIRRLLQSVLHQ